MVNITGSEQSAEDASRLFLELGYSVLISKMADRRPLGLLNTSNIDCAPRERYPIGNEPSYLGAAMKEVQSVAFIDHCIAPVHPIGCHDHICGKGRSVRLVRVSQIA